jgi:hypothetical protein
MPARRRPSAPRRSLGPKRGRTSELAAFKRKVARVLESIEARLDYLESEASLADGKPIRADKVWKALGL